MRIIITILFLIASTSIHAQERGEIQGIVLDSEMNNQPFAFAHINIKELDTNIRTELDGSFTLNAKPGTYTIVLSFAGYQKIEIPHIIVKAGETTTIEKLSLSALQLDEVQLTQASESDRFRKRRIASLRSK